MFAYFNRKLSVSIFVFVMALCAMGSASAMQPIQWTGKEKIRFMLDHARNIIGVESAGIPLPDTLDKLIGKNILQITPFSALSDEVYAELEISFLSARRTLKPSLISYFAFTQIEQRLKISPYAVDNERVHFVLRMSLLSRYSGKPVAEHLILQKNSDVLRAQEISRAPRRQALAEKAEIKE